MAVTRFQVLRRRPFAGAQPFGEAGPYERIDALVSYAVDPAAAENEGIVDLERAPRDAGGRVHFEGDVTLLRPLGGGNGRLYASVVNRGRTPLVPLSYPPAGFVPGYDDTIEPGDGLLLQSGYTIALIGWQWDVIRRPGALGLDAPIALEADGSPTRTQITVRFQPLTARASEYLGHWPMHPNFTVDRMHTAYPPASFDDPGDVLTVRDTPDGDPVTLPRDSWRFARVEPDTGDEAANANWVTVDGGFDVGRVYELRYTTARCPVAGTGLLAIRDAGSFLRFGTAGDGNPSAGELRHTFVHGVSQTGRFLREFLHAGCNVDEAGRQVYDGVFVQIAGARRGEFNVRGAQPSVQYGGPCVAPPYAYTPTAACGEGLIDRQRARGGVPKIFELNTANEYWRSDAILVHTDPATGADIVVPDEVRIYMLAGCQHGPGIPFLSDRSPLVPEQRVTNYLSVLNYTPATRAAFLTLAAWAAEGVEPPPSCVPSLAAGTAIAREEAMAVVAQVPGAGLPTPSAYAGPTAVPALDADGNDIAGIRLPELAVPLATSTGWNVRHAETGGEGLVADMAGSTFPFAKDAAARGAAGDPRPSLAERYRDRDDYRARVHAAGRDLARQRFILEGDVDRIADAAARLYDRVTGAV